MSGSGTAARNPPNAGAQSAPAAGGDAVKSSTGDGAPKEGSVGGNTEGIDVRITVTARRSGAGRDKIAGSKTVKLVAPRNLLARRVGVPIGTQPVVRNAVGAVVLRREGFEQHNDGRSLVVAPSSISGTSNPAGSTIGKITKPPGSFERPTTSVIVRPVVVNRGAINGTKFDTPRFCSIGNRRTGQNGCRHQRHHDQVAALTCILLHRFFYVAAIEASN